MKVFFSYARSDAEFALKLAKDLKSAGIDVWMDQLDINPGDRWDNAVEHALKACPSFLIILSPASVASQNVMDEVSFAIENGKKIVPVLYQNCDIPFRLKRLQYIDFTRNYNEGITRLLSELADNSSSFPLPKIHTSTATLTKRTKVMLAAFILAGTLGGALILWGPILTTKLPTPEDKEWTRTVDTPNGRLSYNARTGAGRVERFDSAGISTILMEYPPGAFSLGWTHIVNTPNGILLYNASTGAGAVGRIDSSGKFKTIKSYEAGEFAKGWTSIENTPEGILYRNANTGASAFGQIDSAGNHTTRDTNMGRRPAQ